MQVPGDHSVVPGFGSSARLGVDYGFPLEEHERVRRDHPQCEVIRNIDTGDLLVFVRRPHGSPALLFSVRRGEERSVNDRLWRLQWEARQDRDRDFVREAEEREERELDEAAKAFVETEEHDAVATKMADALVGAERVSMRGTDGRDTADSGRREGGVPAAGKPEVVAGAVERVER